MFRGQVSTNSGDIYAGDPLYDPAVLEALASGASTEQVQQLATAAAKEKQAQAAQRSQAREIMYEAARFCGRPLGNGDLPGPRRRAAAAPARPAPVFEGDDDARRYLQSGSSPETKGLPQLDWSEFPDHQLLVVVILVPLLLALALLPGAARADHPRRVKLSGARAPVVCIRGVRADISSYPDYPQWSYGCHGTCRTGRTPWRKRIGVLSPSPRRGARPQQSSASVEADRPSGWLRRALSDVGLLGLMRPCRTPNARRPSTSRRRAGKRRRISGRRSAE